MKEFFQHPLYGHYGQDTVAELCWCLGILLTGIIFGRLITKGLVLLIYRFLKKYSGKKVGPEKLFLLLRRPLKNVILLLAVYFAFDRLSFPSEWNLASDDKFGIKMLLSRGFFTLFAIAFTLVLLRMVDFFGLVMKHRSHSARSKSNQQLVPFLVESLKVLIVIFSMFVALGSIFRINVASLIAGLGIGGLAVALAAKESVENLLGSFTIFLDKPFLVGDHVKVGTIDGTVESIGFRSTRLRTIEKTYLTVPNKKMVDAELDNLSLRTERRIRFMLHLVYATSPEQLKQITADIHTLFDSFPDILKADRQVRLHAFGPHSIEMLILFYLGSNDSNLYIRVLEEVNYGILRIVKRNGSDFAYSLPD
ncbi:MAG TPA: mechanosensitive ion channel family protein [Bacteroidia bacterium]|jgi:MscS family membrane protein|nr:mechanosensitive ion channel family protein [Bacteroidia bacterium]